MPLTHTFQFPLQLNIHSAHMLLSYYCRATIWLAGYVKNRIRPKQDLRERAVRQLRRPGLPRAGVGDPEAPGAVPGTLELGPHAGGHGRVTTRRSTRSSSRTTAGHPPKGHRMKGTGNKGSDGNATSQWQPIGTGPCKLCPVPGGLTAHACGYRPVGAGL